MKSKNIGRSAFFLILLSSRGRGKSERPVGNTPELFLKKDKPPFSSNLKSENSDTEEFQCGFPGNSRLIQRANTMVQFLYSCEFLFSSE